MARRTLAASLCALAALTFPTSALAHEGSPDYESIVRGVAPAIDGFTVEVLNGDDRLEVTSQATETVTIYGYDDEPYVRMDPDGSSQSTCARPPTTSTRTASSARRSPRRPTPTRRRDGAS